MLLKDKVLLITGASAGIGRAVAIEAARQGADVAINYFDPTDDNATETVAAIAATGVDRVSTGWPTHDAPWLDVALDWR